MKRSVIIVEDEPLARKTLRDLLAGADWLEVVAEAPDGLAAVELINTRQPDLIFLDVNLPGLSGLEVLKRLTHEPAVVFTTAYDQHAIAAFELSAVDYLLKPFGRTRFQQALTRARALLEQSPATARPALSDLQSGLGSGPLQRLLIRDAGRILPLLTAEIERLEADGDYVAVRARGRTHLVTLTLAALEQRLDPARFVRIHRSHVVNLDFVEALEPFDNAQLLVRMKDGAKIAASRSASKRLRELAI